MTQPTVIELSGLPKQLRTVARIFAEAGFSVYLVGGAVRNLLSGKQPEDYDLATDAVPQQVMRLFRRVIPTGVQHGTVTVLFKGEQFEVTTFRSESTYSDARRPDAVEFGVDIETDLSRRDFTINGMALDLRTGVLHDPFGGRADLAQGVIRAIGDPAERFTEDALRVLRAVRFATQLQFRLADTTRAALTGRSRELSAVSMERTREELAKILLADRPSYGLGLLRDCCLLTAVLPELQSCVGHSRADGAELFTHLVRCCDLAPTKPIELRLAALLHAVAEAAGSQSSDDPPEARSATLAYRRLIALRFPNATASEVAHLIGNMAFEYRPDWAESDVRRFVSTVGDKHVDALLIVARADRLACGDTQGVQDLDELAERVARVRERNDPLTIRDLAVDGNQLAAAGIPRGPLMGRVLEALLDAVLAEPHLNRADRLLPLARQTYEQLTGEGDAHRGGRRRD